MSVEDLNLQKLDPADFPTFGKFVDRYVTVPQDQSTQLPVGPRPVADLAEEREDQLRQLLSYCLAKPGTRNGVGEYYDGERDAFEDVAAKLAAILDGES